MTEKPRRLLDQVRDVLRLKHYAIRTEEAYTDWIRRFTFNKSRASTRMRGGRANGPDGAPYAIIFLALAGLQTPLAVYAC